MRFIKEKAFIWGMILSFCFPTICNAQMMTTIAGTGIAGFSGDGGAATTSQISLVYSLDVDTAGNVYSADYSSNYRVRKIATSGIITTIAGTGTLGFSGDGAPATDATLGPLLGIATDAMGNVYITGGGSFMNRIRKIDAAGIITTIAGTGSPGFYGDGGLATAAAFNSPRGMTVDAAGNIYVADQANFRVRKITPGGIITTVAGNGTGAYSGDGGAATAAGLRPYDVAVDAAGNLYIAGAYAGSHYIRKVNTAGIISTLAGTGTAGYSGDGGPATAAEISMANGSVCVDPVGNIYFADASHRIRKVNASGIITTIAGSGVSGFNEGGCAATNGQLNTPANIVSDRSGNLYVCDQLNYRIRKIYQGSIPLFAAGASQPLNICRDSVANINSQLAVTDGDLGQAINWSVLATPTHGTLAATYSNTTTGSLITPSGLSYTPAPGYSGTDTFKVLVTDCSNAADTTTVYVTISDCTLGTGQVLLQKDALQLYPNPTREGSFTIHLPAPANEDIQITIRNVIGEKVKELIIQTNTPSSMQLAVPPGLYFISAATQDGVCTGRLLVTK